MMTRTVKVIENALDVATQIILLENVQNHRKIRTKELLSEALGAIAVKKMMKRYETYLVAHASSEVCSESSYFSDENSLIDDIALDNEYDKLCKMSQKIITNVTPPDGAWTEYVSEGVRIMQTYQENGKNQTNTDTGTDKECTRAGSFYQWSKVNSWSTLVNKSTIVRHKKTKP
ncbi:hypothetical protein Tco_1471124 [Tanacetum coccineum]